METWLTGIADLTEAQHTTQQLIQAHVIQAPRVLQHRSKSHMDPPKTLGVGLRA